MLRLFGSGRCDPPHGASTTAKPHILIPSCESLVHRCRAGAILRQRLMFSRYWFPLGTPGQPAQPDRNRRAVHCPVGQPFQLRYSCGFAPPASAGPRSWVATLATGTISSSARRPRPDGQPTRRSAYTHRRRRKRAPRGPAFGNRVPKSQLRRPPIDMPVRSRRFQSTESWRSRSSEVHTTCICGRASRGRCGQRPREISTP